MACQILYLGAGHYFRCWRGNADSQLLFCVLKLILWRWIKKKYRRWQGLQLNACVLPKIHMLGLSPPVWYWRWGLWKVIRIPWRPKDGALMMGLALVRRGQRASWEYAALSLSIIWKHSKTRARRTVLTPNWPCWYPDLENFQLPELWEINFCC